MPRAPIDPNEPRDPRYTRADYDREGHKARVPDVGAPVGGGEGSGLSEGRGGAPVGPPQENAGFDHDLRPGQFGQGVPRGNSAGWLSQNEVPADQRTMPGSGAPGSGGPVAVGPSPWRGPKGYVRSDERIYEEACELIASRHDIDASDVTVSVEAGDITLEGTVATRHEKVFVERLLDHMRGVHDVHNRLRIRIPRDWEPKMDATGRPIPRRIV